MKRNALVLLSAILLLSISSAAFATIPFDGSGDCAGWTFSGSLMFGSADYMDVEYTVELFQGDDLLVYSIFEQVALHRNDADFVFNGSWGMELCGDYKLVIVFTFYGPWGTYSERLEYMFTCDCVPETCTYTPGYWKNHEEAWPVDGLTVGCVDYTKAQLLEIFDWSTENGDMTIKLFHHLVAAKLNVLIGADDYIMSAITAGDDLLCMYPLGNNPVGDLKTDAEAIKDDLADYNEIECEEEEDDDMLTIDGPVTVDKAAAATEESSWGSIKKKHQ